jgi:hypothetical protein
MSEETDITLHDEEDLAQTAPETGPYDDADVSNVRPWVDLGSIKLIPRDGLNLRLEVEEGTSRVVAASLDFEGSTLQIQPFSSSKSGGLWDEIRTDLKNQLESQSGQVAEVEGPVGPELVATIPVMVPGEGLVAQPARFLGVDGPRWFLRGVIAGPAVNDPELGEKMMDIFRGLVVVRGNQPLPPRELLPLRMPAQAAGA